MLGACTRLADKRVLALLSAESSELAPIFYFLLCHSCFPPQFFTLSYIIPPSLLPFLLPQICFPLIRVTLLPPAHTHTEPEKERHPARQRASPVTAGNKVLLLLDQIEYVTLLLFLLLPPSSLPQYQGGVLSTDLPGHAIDVSLTQFTSMSFTEVPYAIPRRSRFRLSDCVPLVMRWRGCVT